MLIIKNNENIHLQISVLKGRIKYGIPILNEMIKKSLQNNV